MDIVGWLQWNVAATVFATAWTEVPVLAISTIVVRKLAKIFIAQKVQALGDGPKRIM